jgi:carbon storage regulator
VFWNSYLPVQPGPRGTWRLNYVRQQSFTKKIDQGLDMLVLSRKKDEKIVIGDSITLMVIEIRGDKVRLGIEAPRDVTVHREEVYEAIKRENTPDTKQG